MIGNGVYLYSPKRIAHEIDHECISFPSLQDHNQSVFFTHKKDSSGISLTSIEHQVLHVVDHIHVYIVEPKKTKYPDLFSRSKYENVLFLIVYKFISDLPYRPPKF